MTEGGEKGPQGRGGVRRERRVAMAGPFLIFVPGASAPVAPP